MATTTRSYRNITSDFLDRNWAEGFDVYQRVVVAGKPQFSKCAHYTPDQHEKIIAILAQKNETRFFIHENDLIRYYKECLLETLKKSATTPDKTPYELLKDSYHLAVRIMEEYFNDAASERILYCLDGVVEIMGNCLLTSNFSFPKLFFLGGRTESHPIHCANVGLFSMFVGVLFKMNSEAIRELGIGGMLHDVGKKNISEEIWEKEGKLTTMEFEEIKRHAAYGKKTLGSMKSYPENVLRIAGEHHEKFDGKGYPAGLSGENISLQARLCAIMDVFVALTSDRPQRPAVPPARALSIMKNEMPGAFDPRILANFFRLLLPAS